MARDFQPWPGQPDIRASIENAASSLRTLGKHGLALARQYSFRRRIFEQLRECGRNIAEYTLDEAELFLLNAANEIDMHLSLEIAVTGRGDVMSDAQCADCLELLRYVGLQGLAATLAEVRERPVTLPLVSFGVNEPGSFALPNLARAS